MSGRESIQRYATRDVASAAEHHTDDDGDDAPQMPVADYSDMLISFAAYEGPVLVLVIYFFLYRMCIVFIAGPSSSGSKSEMKDLLVRQHQNELNVTWRHSIYPKALYTV